MLITSELQSDQGVDVPPKGILIPQTSTRYMEREPNDMNSNTTITTPDLSTYQTLVYAGQCNFH